MSFFFFARTEQERVDDRFLFPMALSLRDYSYLPFFELKLISLPRYQLTVALERMVD